MNVHRTLVASTLFAAWLLPSVEAQTSSTTTGQTQQAPQAAQPQDSASRRRAVATPEPLGDFVPCLLDGDQQWAMRGMANPNDPANAEKKPVTEDEAKAYGTAVPNAVARVSPDLADKLRIDADLAPSKLAGLTRGEVIDTFTASIKKATDSLMPPNLPTSKAANSATLAAATEKAASVVNPGPTPYKRPADVSCSMSIMGYKETKAIFGASVADNYLAIQVTVRNLNAQNDFLIHDVQAAVDTGVDEGYFGRLQSGRDKLLVRAVVQRGQVTDPRNLILNSLQVVGAIAAVPTAGMANEVATAVAIFNGQFLPGLSNIVPDPTITYTNHVNDLVFSSSASSKTIVPVNGSVPFVTFIAQKPIQELPFAWCGYTTQERRWKKSPFVGFPSYGGVLEYCQDPAQRPAHSDGVPAYRSNYDPAKSRAKSDTVDSKGDAGSLEWDDLPYKKWKGAALRILEQNTFVVVGGTHIKDAGNVTVNAPDCPHFPNGHVDISQTTSGKVVCKITGTGLGQFKGVELVQGTTKLAGDAAPASGGNSAQLTFDPAVLADGDGAYSLFLVDPTGAETDSQNSVSLSKQPLVKSLDKTEIAATPKPAALALGAAAPKPATTPITLSGANLDRITGVAFKDASGGGSLTATLGKATANNTSLTIDVRTDGAAAGDYTLSYAIQEVPGKSLPSSDPPTLKITAAAAKPAQPTKKPPKKAGR